MTAIVVNGLAKRFGRQQVLDGLDLAVPAGDAIAVVGPSGSGKTTLLRLIAGLERPDAGTISLNGALASTNEWALAPHRRHIGYVFQAPALWPHMTVAQNVLFGLKGLSAAQALERARALLGMVGLAGFESRYPDQLSVGQARRVALVRALAPLPRILLLDEALTNVEQELKDRLLALVRTHVAETAATLIHVTHDPVEAERLAGQVLELRGGKLHEP